MCDNIMERHPRIILRCDDCSSWHTQVLLLLIFAFSMYVKLPLCCVRCCRQSPRQMQLALMRLRTATRWQICMPRHVSYEPKVSSSARLMLPTVFIFLPVLIYQLWDSLPCMCSILSYQHWWQAGCQAGIRLAASFGAFGFCPWQFHLKERLPC